MWRMVLRGCLVATLVMATSAQADPGLCVDDASCITTWSPVDAVPQCVVLTADGLRCADVDPAFAPMPSSAREGGLMKFGVDVRPTDCEPIARRALEAAQKLVRDPDEPPSFVTTSEYRPPCMASCQLEEKRRAIADQKEAARLIADALGCIR